MKAKRIASFLMDQTTQTMRCNTCWRLFSLIFFLLLSFSGTGQQEARLTERDYADHIQNLIGGEREVRVDGGRIDLLTPTHAFEIERAHNWKEAIGQAIWYGLQTNKKPGIILIQEKQSEYRYFLQLNTALDYAGLLDSVTVLLFPRDFGK